MMRLITPAESLPERPKRGCRGCLTVVGVVVVLLLGWCHYTPNNRFPAAALNAVAHDPKGIFYSLAPRDYATGEQGIGEFRGVTVLGQTTLTDRADREAIVDAIAAASRGAWDHAACFDPRHGFRAVSAEGTYDFLLCFACGGAQVFLPDGSTKWVLIQGDVDFFNRYLSEHGVPLTKG